MSRKRILLIILDGLGDRPSRALDGKTPLMAANKPTIDRLASEGMNGIMDPVAPGIPVGSDTGHLALLGYDPYKYYTGRGPLEAAGAGIEMSPGDVAFRYNLATVDEGWRVIDRRAGRISTEEGRELVEALSDLAAELSRNGLEIVIKHTVEHRGVLVIKGTAISGNVTDVDPHHEGATITMPRPLDTSPEAARTAEVLSEFIRRARDVLSAHPINRKRVEVGKRVANALLTRGGGVMPNLPKIPERFKIKCSIIAGGALYKGVGRCAGMEVVEVEGATGTLNTNLKGKFSIAIDRLKVDDLVLLHVKGTDSASHDKDPQTKARFISKVDETFARVIDGLNSNTIVCITGDHTTSSATGEHRGDPVPILVWGEGVRRDQVVRFDEVSCSSGALCRIRGTDVMNVLLDLADVLEKYGE